MTARSRPPNTDDQKLDQIRARGAWIAIFLALAGWIVYIVKSGDTATSILLAFFFPLISAVIAYLFNPGDMQIVLHMRREWRTALVLTVLLGIGLGSAWAMNRPEPPKPPEKVIKIGVDLPLTGSDQAEGRVVLNGIKLAIEEAPPIDGYRFKMVEKSDDNKITQLNDPDVGADNIRDLMADPQVAGIIGPYNSGVAIKEIPIINGANKNRDTIALISPSTTADCLTTSAYPSDNCNNLNSQGSFFRLAALNSKIGEVFANCLSAPFVGPNDLCPNPNFHLYKNVVILDDSTPYSTGLAKSFRYYWQIHPDNKAVSRNVSNKASAGSIRTALADAIKELGTTPDVIYFAGSEDNAITMHRVMQQTPQSGLPNLSPVPFAGDAGIMNKNFVGHLWDQPPKGPIYTAAPIKNLDTENTEDQKDSREFIRRYEKRFKVKPAPYSATGYDATKILMQAIQTAAGKSGIPAAGDKAAVQDFRNKIIFGIKNPVDDVTGITGHYSFDEMGDYRDAAVSVYKWNPNNHHNQNGWDYQ